MILAKSTIMGNLARFIRKGWNIQPMLGLYAIRRALQWALSTSETQILCRRFSNLHLQYSLLREEYRNRRELMSMGLFNRINPNKPGRIALRGPKTQ